MQLSSIIPQFSSVQSLSRVRLFATPWIPARQASLSITNSRSSLRLTSIETMMPSSHLILCRPLLVLLPISPSIRVFSNESALPMRWPKVLELQPLASVLPMNIQDWFPLVLTGLISLLSRDLSRVLPGITVQKHQIFGIQPSLWFNSHICWWLLEKWELWLYRSLSAKWCLCFLIHCLGIRIMILVYV